MKITKFLGIWLAAMLVIVLLVNAVGTLFVKTVYANTLIPSMYGYSKKMHLPLTPATDEKTQKENGALMRVRELMGDSTLYTGKNIFANFVFSNLAIDQNNIFLSEENGLTEFSSGIFATVYEDTGSKMHLTETIGMADIRAFSELDCAKQVYDVLVQHPDAKVMVNSYTIQEYLVTPASLTLLDASGTELLTVECPHSGEVIEADNLVITNNNEIEEDGDSLLRKLEVAFAGERRCDRTAHDLIDSVQYSPDQDEQTYSYRIGSFMSKHLETHDGYAMISVLEFHYLADVLFYVVILGVIMTVIVAFIVFRRR